MNEIETCREVLEQQLYVASCVDDSLSPRMKQLSAALSWLATVEAAQMPQPDWSTAPEWAMWWAVDPNGWAHWFQEEPVLALTINYCGWIAKTIQGLQQGAELWAAELDLALGIDWRLLKQRRPQEDK